METCSPPLGCVGGTPKVCVDADPCTADLCNSSTGLCAFPIVGDGTPCDDGEICTKEDTCASGECTGEPDADCLCDCDLEIATAPVCQTVVCEGPAYECELVPVVNGLSCSDGSACTDSDSCQGGDCVGEGVTCSDQNPCTVDSCDPIDGCLFAHDNGAPCSDDDACTSGDECSNGACVVQAISCDDGNVCTLDQCAPASGCSYVPQAVDCDDADPCSTDDVCAGGACQGGPAADCDDKNPCTIDACTPGSGCTNSPAQGACDDGDPCTQLGECQQGSCVPGELLDCSAGQACGLATCAGDCQPETCSGFALSALALRDNENNLDYFEGSSAGTYGLDLLNSLSNADKVDISLNSTGNWWEATMSSPPSGTVYQVVASVALKRQNNNAGGTLVMAVTWEGGVIATQTIDVDTLPDDDGTAATVFTLPLDLDGADAAMASELQVRLTPGSGASKKVYWSDVQITGQYVPGL